MTGIQMRRMKMTKKDTSEFKKQARAHIRYRLEDGTLVPGVTTILGILAKPALIRWANKMGLEGIDTTKYVDAAARVGTLTHYMVECDLRGVEPDLGDYTPNEIDRADNAFIKYLDYRDEHALAPAIIEKPLVSEKYRYGGTIDFYGLEDDVPTLLDFKTGKAIYSEMLIQAVAYRQLVLEQGYPVKRLRILRIGRSEDEGFEQRTVGNIRELWQIFKHCLAIYELRKRAK